MRETCADDDELEIIMMPFHRCRPKARSRYFDDTDTTNSPDRQYVARLHPGASVVTSHQSVGVIREDLKWHTVFGYERSVIFL
jgi:hypothetical protein